jgi:general secretion pathway protein J
MKQRGFTLIELLVAISLLGIIMVMAYQGFRIGTRSVDQGEVLVDRTNRLRVVHQFLRSQLTRAMPLAMKSEEIEDQDLAVIFEGGDEFMRFVAPMPGYLGHGGPHEQHLRLARGSDGLELIYGHRLLHSLDEGDPLADFDRPPIVLLDGIRDGRFSYLTLDEEGEPTDWIDDWEDPSVSPVMIRVELEMADHTRMVWPTLEVAPLIDGAAARRNRNITNLQPTQARRRNAASE